jgi:release factor glutamine methyltransferase
MAEWTIRALMEWTEKHFQEKGIESPRLESQLLLAHALKCKKPELYTRWDEPVFEEHRGRFRDLIKRRLEGCPIQYLIGHREFFLLEFEVTPAVLIPRPETELLVAESLKRIEKLASPHVLDVGTGSGCIAIAIAHRHKNARVTAIDISAEALEVARRNAARHGVADRIRFLQGDLFAPLEPNLRFDAVVSNPPYVSQPEWERLPAHIRDHEPRLALEAGPDGFAIFDRLVPAVVTYLQPGGYLLLEIGAGQDQGVGQRFQQQPELVPGASIRDDQGLPRIACAQRGSP